MKINCNVSGFLKNIAYTAYLPEIIKDCEDKFDHLDILIELDLEEISYPRLGHKKHQSIEFFKNEGKGIITLRFSRLYDKKGNVTSTPSPESVLLQVKAVLDNTINQYIDEHLK